MDGNVISGWCISQKQGEEESIEGYLKAWDAIKELDIGPSHVNLAAEIANRFMSGGHYANMVHFVNNLDESFLQNMKGNEKFARSLIALRMTQRKYSEVFTLLEDGRFTNKEGLLEMWDEAHYREWEERMGKPLNALLRYRIRQRFLPPQHICPNGTRPTTRLPDQALKILKEWLMQHPNDPYPSKIDKDLLMKKSGLSLSQVKTWFANARRRLRLKKEKRDKGGALDGEGMTCSEHDGSSDSPEDLFSGEDIVLKDEDDGGNVSGLGGEPNRDHESSHDGGFVSYARNNNRYNSLSSEQPQNLVCGTLEQNGIPKSEKWPEPIIQSVYPPNTAANHMPLFQTGRMSTSYIPCHQATQTSEYLKAMAGMCEEITPSTYQLGAPRPPKHTLCHTLSDLQSMQHSRTATCSVVQDDSYRCVSYQKQSQQPDHGSLYSSLRGSPCLGDAFTQRQKKWYQGHESSLIRSYSMSAPPSLMPLTTVTSHQPFQHPTNSLMSGMLRDQLQDPSWSAYQTTFNERCFMCCSGQCSGSHPASSLHPNDNTNVPLPSFGRPIVGSNAGLPMMHHEPPVTTMQQMTTQSSQPDQGFRQWTPVKRLTNDQQRGPLPAFHTSFDILKLPIPPLPLSHHLYEQGQTDSSPKNVIGHGYPSLRPPEVPNQTNQAILSSLRRRHRSQPAIASEPLEAPVYLRTSTSPTTGISKSLSNTPELVKPDFTRPFRKRSASIAESEAKNIKYVKHSSHQPIVPAECSKVFTKAPIQGSIPNGQQAHVKHVDAATNQMSPPHAHVHQKPKPSIPVDAEEPLCSTSLDPSLSTHTQANPTESREGMKEIAQVLLDLSTKGSKTDS